MPAGLLISLGIMQKLCKFLPIILTARILGFELGVACVIAALPVIVLAMSMPQYPLLIFFICDY